MTGTMLGKAQVDAFWRDGYLVVEEAVTDEQLRALRQDIDAWVAESRDHDEPFGPPCADGRPRFDLGPDHDRDHPALRRVNNPSEVSDAFLDELFVVPVHRGQGIATRLLDALEQEARGLGIRAVTLEVDQGNGRARGLYESRGYRLRDRFCLLTKAL